MTQSVLQSIVAWIMFVVYGKDAANAILYVIHESEIFDPVRGYIEARYPGSKLEYLINCPFCLSYWISLFIATLFILLSIFTPLFNSNKIVILILGLFTFLSIAGQQVSRIKTELSNR